jgi:hypothetical protein
VEIIGLIVTGSLGVAGLGAKLISAMRGYDRALENLRHDIGLSNLESERQRAQLREHLLKLEASLDLLRSELGLRRSIAASPRARRIAGDTIE